MQCTTSALAPAVAAPGRVQQQRASSSRPRSTHRVQQRRWQHVARAEPGKESEQAASQQAAPADAPQQQPPKIQREEDEPVWVRRERERQLQGKEGGSGELPFALYLLFSSFTAIAAVGSVFEYVNRNPIFDVIQPDSPLYAPILGFFAISGLPTSAYLFYKGVQSANKEAERMDKMDGY